MKLITRLLELVRVLSGLDSSFPRHIALPLCSYHFDVVLEKLLLDPDDEHSHPEEPNPLRVE